MRMIVSGEGQLAGGFVGLAVEESLHGIAAMTGRRPADRGTVRMRTLTFNRKDEVVQRFTAVLLVPRSAGLPG